MARQDARGDEFDALRFFRTGIIGLFQCGMTAIIGGGGDIWVKLSC